MKIPSSELHRPATTQSHRASGCIAIFTLTLLLVTSAFGQAPGLLWSTNVGATLFAVDAETNVYANAGGTVVKLDSSGQVLATNLLNARATRMQRDSAGNYYLCGITPWEFVSNWNFTNPACFLAKYSAGGGLIWSNNFGPTGVIYVNGIQVTDLQLLSDGTVYAGFWYRISSQIVHSEMAKLDSAGSNLWTVSVQRGSFGGHSTPASVRFGPLTATNGFVIGYGYFDPTLAVLAAFDYNGASGTGVNWASSGLSQSYFTKPSNTKQGDWFNVEGGNLVKRSPGGSLILSSNVVDSSYWIASPDPWDGVYVGTSTNSLLRFDSGANLTGTLGLSAICNSMIVDPQGNHFFSTTSGDVSRLTAKGVAIFLGNQMLTNGTYNFITPPTLSVRSAFANGSSFYTTDGSPPSFASTPYSGPFQINSSATVRALGYSADFLRSEEADPVNIVLAPPLSLSMTSTPGGYVTLNPPGGAYPSNTVVTATATAINGWYFLYWLGDASGTNPSVNVTMTANKSIQAVFGQKLSLSVTSTPGGYVTLNPSGGAYPSNAVVTATATATNGWSFLYWLGGASGTNPSVNVTMTANKSVQAVFGTTLSTTVAGNGQVLLYPAGGVYLHGTIVRLTGVPQPGNFFGVWGNAASGNINPLYFTITNPSPTVSSLFAATPVGQSALTVVITGRGQVTVNPRANAYATNQSVTLTATPDAGETFLRWSGDASGTLNPLSVSMDQGRVVVANFTGPFQLRADRPGIEGLLPQGFRFTVVGDPFATYQIFSSTNLSDWATIGSVTNVAPETQFTDPSATNAPKKFYKASQ